MTPTDRVEVIERTLRQIAPAGVLLSTIHDTARHIAAALAKQATAEWSRDNVTEADIERGDHLAKEHGW